MDNTLYMYALFANLAFAIGTLFFTVFTQKTSAAWVNFFKASVAGTASIVVISLFYTWNPISMYSFLLFLTSGFVALKIGDFFLLKSFSRIGPGRTLILFGFHPLIMGILGYFVLGQTVDTQKLFAIVFLLACLFTFSYEKFKTDGKWEIRGFVYSLIGISLDAIGLIISRVAFDDSPQISALEGNFYRCVGAVGGYLILNPFFKFELIGNFKKLVKKDRVIIFLASLLGTFFSLWAYYKAIQHGHLASISAISVTAPFFATLIESIYKKQMPNRYLILAFVFFIIGFAILL